MKRNRKSIVKELMQRELKEKRKMSKLFYLYDGWISTP